MIFPCKGLAPTANVQRRLASRFLGAALLAVWGSFAVLSWGFRLDVEPAGRPFGWLFGCLALAFALWLATLHCFWNAGRNQLSWRAVMLWAVAMRLPLVLGSHPVQEIDYYRYLWDGRSVLAGVSPYRYSPADLDGLRSLDEAAPSPADVLIDVLDRSPAWETIFSRIDHREVPTIYPPVSQAVFSAAVVMVPDRAGVYPRVVALRTVLAAFDLGIVVLLLGWLTRRKLPPGRAILYAWCPLVLKEFANGVHMDVIPAFFTVAAWLLAAGAMSEENKIRAGGFWWLAWLAWIAGVLAKWYPLILGPILLARGWSRWRWRALDPAALVGLMAPHQLWPMLNPGVPGSRDTEGLRTFLERWEMNDLVFSVIRENLRLPVEAAEGPWYAVLPASARRAWWDGVAAAVAWVGLAVPSDIGFATARAWVAIAVGGVAVWLSLRRWPADGDEDAELGRRFFTVLAVAWYLSATQNPWYWCWSLPFAVVARWWIWRLVPAFAAIYYARFWLIYHFPNSMAGGLSGARFFDEIVVWIEHGLPILLAVACLIRQWTANAGNKTSPNILPFPAGQISSPPTSTEKSP